jgi:hypothetical protein
LTYLAVVPLLIKEQSVVVIGHDGWAESPWTLETASVGVATTESVSTAQSNNLLIVEAHAAKDVSEMLLFLGSIWETAIWCAHGDITVDTAWAPWDDGPLHLLNSSDTTKGPEIGVGDPRKSLC